MENALTRMHLSPGGPNHVAAVCTPEMVRLSKTSLQCAAWCELQAILQLSHVKTLVAVSTHMTCACEAWLAQCATLTSASDGTPRSWGLENLGQVTRGNAQLPVGM